MYTTKMKSNTNKKNLSTCIRVRGRRSEKEVDGRSSSIWRNARKYMDKGAMKSG